MIDNQLLNAYIAELEALRDHGREFAEQFPEVASRLDIGPRESRDAHVERVVESAAFLAARLRLLLERDAAQLPQAILAALAPSLVEPVPSMAIMQLIGGTEAEPVPARTRFDVDLGGSPACFSTAIPTTAMPLALATTRVDPGVGHADGLNLRIERGSTPDPWLLYLGSDPRSGTVLMDAIDEALERIEIVALDGTRRRVPKTAVRIHGFDNADALLPARPATHAAHRILVEYLVFPDKFRFISLRGVEIGRGEQLRLLFNRPLNLPTPLPPNLINLNCVPVVNLWNAPAAPIEVSGRQLEYPVTVDALRYRTVECHSVENVDLYYSDATEAQRIDPLLALGRVNDTDVRWGIRRRQGPHGGEVLLYFQGLDYRTLGRTQILATLRVMASNRDLAYFVRVGQPATPVEGLGTWRGSVHTTPTPYRHPMANEVAQRTLIGYLHSSMKGLIVESGRGSLRQILKSFPGGSQATWIDGIGACSFEPVTVLRAGEPQSGLALSVRYDSHGHPTTSRAMVRRVLGRLIESQRGLNRVEEVRLDA